MPKTSRISQTRNKKKVILLIGVVVLILTWVLSQKVFNTYFLKFDQGKWLSFDEMSEIMGSRRSQIEPFLDSRFLVDGTKESIVELLGRPAERTISVCDMAYFLGREASGYGVDSDWLCIKFTSKRNKVSIVTD